MKTILLIRTVLSNTHALRLLLFFAVALAGYGSLHAAPLLTYNFDSLSTGDLAGQDGWVVTNSALSPVITAGPTPNTTNVAGRSTGNTGIAQVKNTSLYAAGSLSTSSTVTLTFDVFSGAGNSAELFGIGNSSYAGGANPGAMFGIFSNAFMIRPESNGTIVNAVNSSGSNVTVTLNHWYTLESVWDLSTMTATLAVKDITAGDTTFTTLYFNAAQTQTTVSIVNPLNGATDPSLWSAVYLRTGNSNNGLGYLDNLSVTVVPEPSTVAFLTAGMAFLSIFRHRAVSRI